jgi:hypothetical protein
MDPNIWGPHAWMFLHTITLNYPKTPTEQDKQNYKNFFNNLLYVLPCANCAHNYQLHLKKYPIHNFLNTRNHLIKWLIKIHNEVNTILNKPQFSYSEFKKKYKSIYNNQDNPLFNKYFIAILTIFIICMLYYFKSDIYSYLQLDL